jgi:hypothetical protein
LSELETFTMNAKHSGRMMTLGMTFGSFGSFNVVGGIAAIALLAGTALGQASGTSAPAKSGQATTTAQGSSDQSATPVEATLIFKNGRVLKGTIVSETTLTLKFKGESHGIPFETEYQKSELLEVQRGAPAAKTGAAGGAATPPAAPAIVAPAGQDGNQDIKGDRVYFMELKGKFGEDITLEPIKDVLKDARNLKTTTLIMVVNNQVFDAESDGAAEDEQIATDYSEINRVQPILSHLLQQMPRDWERAGQSPPRLVTWVKKALGGPAFLPLITKDIYFAPEGKLGGVGYMDVGIISRGGSRRVLEKWLAASLQTAVGWVNHSGFAQPEELCRALTMVRDVYTLRIENGRPTIVTGYPANPGEILLTDDGEGANADNIIQLARGEGNDVLTITADLATTMALSKGTVSTEDELLLALGYTRDNVLKGRSEQILKNWSDGLIDARAALRRYREEFADIRVEGDWTERRNARSSQLRKIDQMKSTLTQWGDGLDPYWLRRNGYPINGDGSPNLVPLEAQQDTIRAAQLADRR